MFAWALMSKPTAFIDVAMFGLLLVGLWINVVVAIGAGLMIIGATGILGIANAPDMINPMAGSYLTLLGAIIALAGIAHMIIKKYRTNDTKRLIKYIGIRIVSIIGVLLVFKGPNILIHQIVQKDFSPGKFIQRVFLVQESATLLATTEYEDIEQQNTIDYKVLSEKQLAPEECSVITFSETELEDGMREAIVTNEDVGRYVGYGRKDIRK